MARAVEIRLLGEGDEPLLASADVFDHAPRSTAVSEFLADPRHHVAVALDEGRVVGFASGVHYVHPDKDPELWIAEVGVAESHRRRGIARALVAKLLEHGRALGCAEAWVLTNQDNEPARALYLGLQPQGRDDDVVMYTWRLDGGCRGPSD